MDNEEIKKIIMGNYKSFEHDFIERTMNLISQYDSLLHSFEFNEQYNYTLLINCFLGVFVLPKERLFSRIPNHRLNRELLAEMGLNESKINERITTLREFTIAIRNSISHFNFKIVSNSDKNFIDEIIFERISSSQKEIIISFKSTELLPFMRYYADWIKSEIN